MFNVSIKLPTNFIKKFENLITKKVEETNKKLEINLNKAATFLRDKIKEGYANSSIYGIPKSPKNEMGYEIKKKNRAVKVGYNRYKNSGGRTGALKRTGDMMKSVEVKRKSISKSYRHQSMSIAIGFRNSKYDRIAAIHSAGQGKYPQARDIWKAVYNKHRKEVVSIIRHGK